MRALRREAVLDRRALDLEGIAVVNDERELARLEAVASGSLDSGEALDGELAHDPSILRPIGEAGKRWPTMGENRAKV